MGDRERRIFLVRSNNHTVIVWKKTCFAWILTRQDYTQDVVLPAFFVGHVFNTQFCTQSALLYYHRPQRLLWTSSLSMKLELRNIYGLYMLLIVICRVLFEMHWSPKFLTSTLRLSLTDPPCAYEQHLDCSTQSFILKSPFGKFWEAATSRI